MGSWFLMQKLGRRTIHFSGACTLFVLLMIVGSCSFAGNDASNWAIGAILIVFVFVYDFTIGPVTYSIIAEMPTTRLKSKTINLARALYNTSNIVVNVLTNYQLGSGGWAWGRRRHTSGQEHAVAWLSGFTSGFQSQRAEPTLSLMLCSRARSAPENSLARRLILSVVALMLRRWRERTPCTLSGKSKQTLACCPQPPVISAQAMLGI